MQQQIYNDVSTKTLLQLLETIQTGLINGGTIVDPDNQLLQNITSFDNGIVSVRRKIPPFYKFWKKTIIEVGSVRFGNPPSTEVYLVPKELFFRYSLLFL